MIAEIAKNYRGVLCRRCHEPIPVSSKVMSLQDEIDLGNGSAPHAFILRCRLCDHESVYAMSAICRLEGEPRSRTPRARAAGS